MKQRIHINLLPTYKVDQTTDYTMFNPEDKSVGDLVIYDELLGMLAKKYSIEQITVSGGEISLLSDLYFDLLYNILKLYTKNIHIHTDFNTFNAALINGVDIITVPYNFTENENINFLKNIKAAIQVGKIINMQTIDTACEKEKPETIITLLNGMNIKSWEIIPYQATKYTRIQSRDYSYYEKTVLNFLKYSKDMNFAFYNKLQLDGIIKVENYDLQTVYITPHNKFALAEYKDNLLSLKEFNTIDELTEALNKNKEKQEEYCKACKIKLKCMANYYKNFSNTSNSCCGFSDLIYKYSTEKEQK